MKILLLGPGGQLGHELQRTLRPLGTLITAGRSDRCEIRADLGAPESLDAALAASCPDLIVNAAAYTAVDQAESDYETALRINGEALGVIGAYGRQAGAPVVHFSTDYVFAGDADRPYREEDPVDPVNAYGRSKLAGEKALRESGADHLIFRTAWVYGNHGKNFLRSILRHAESRDRLTIVDDQHGAPAWSRMLAQLSTAAMQRCIDADNWRERSGIYHLSATGQTSWYGFAEAFLTHAAASGWIGRAPELAPIPTSEFPTPAKRPAYSVLDNGRFQKSFGLQVPTWQEQLALCLADFHQPHD
ncbi:MAG: dTDP-4-dehydrorhamnose reductase [Xanthomonadales bacterium]|nr:dTDP-4-dehydrorhamnose reductase [Xanthomonadales bacterium]